MSAREKAIPEIKLERVKKLVGLMKKSSTVMIVSIKGIPGNQFQAIKKKLKEKAEVIVLRKSIMLRALDEAGLEKLKKHVHEDIALVFSKEEAFSLSSILAENQSPAKARTGQIALEDIIIEPGPTDLVPGPAISELGAVGIKIKIESGKINIQEKKILVKKNEKISEKAANILDKLGITPFKVGFIPEVAYDTATKEVYADIKIDKEEALKELKQFAGKTFSLAVKIGYVCRDTIEFLLRKASNESRVLSRFIKQEEKETIEPNKESMEKSNINKQNNIQENKSEEEK